MQFKCTRQKLWDFRTRTELRTEAAHHNLYCFTPLPPFAPAPVFATPLYQLPIEYQRVSPDKGRGRRGEGRAGGKSEKPIRQSFLGGRGNEYLSCLGHWRSPEVKRQAGGKSEKRIRQSFFGSCGDEYCVCHWQNYKIQSRNQMVHPSSQIERGWWSKTDVPQPKEPISLTRLLVARVSCPHIH